MVVDIGSVLLQWQSAGVFDYLLPFLLIFALVMAILQKSKILGDQKGLNIIISVVIGFLALQLDFVPMLFRELFPRVGVAVAVLLILLIFIGMFVDVDDKTKWPSYVLMAIGFVMFLIIIVQSFDRFGWYGSWNMTDYTGWIILAVLLIGLIVAVSVAKNDSGSSKPSKT